jgi:hypothetical protein
MRNCISASKPPKTTNYGTEMPNFQPNQYTQTTFERYEIDEKFQLIAYTKGVGESNREVIPAAERHLVVKTTSSAILKL